MSGKEKKSIAEFHIFKHQIRRELYAQCFDELIRQTTVSCVERGLLLLRIRDEARMTLHAYMVGTCLPPDRRQQLKATFSNHVLHLDFV